MLGEQIEQLDQPPVAPARVVVAEEHVNGTVRRVERGSAGSSQSFESMGL